MVKCVTLEGQSQISAVYDAISNPGNLVAYARMIKPRRATSASMQSPDLNLDLPCLARIVNMESQVFSNKNVDCTLLLHLFLATADLLVSSLLPLSSSQLDPQHTAEGSACCINGCLNCSSPQRPLSLELCAMA